MTHRTPTLSSPASGAAGPHGAARAARACGVLAVWTATLALPADARASLLPPELEDKLASFLALFVLFVVPVVLIVLFWMVHVLPEKIAHKRHHPQLEAIRTLCLLSLVFGGLLWPLAWIWAFTKPTLYKMAYGTDKHPDAEAHAVAADEAPPPTLHDRLARLEAQGIPASELTVLRSDLEALEAKFAHGETR